ncbi:MAG: class II fructose-bisphosphate aldolase [Anaerolineales bacterium]|nr:MAG: class II fructose-bisphosphate aldolase [Anaerolineales bacterium]
MLIPFQDLLADAQAGGYAVGYFDAWDVYSLEAVLEAAESENAPVLLGFGGVMMEPLWFDRGGLERLGALGLAAAQTASVPVAFILNEVLTFAQIVRGIRAGFNVVMLDTSDLPYSENVHLTRQVVQVAHAVGVGVEAEVGALPDASGEMGGGAGRLTEPEEAARFVSETGVDALAVSIGNVHTLTDGKAVIDLERLVAIHEAVSVPLVIHGGTGFPEEAVPQVIPLGVVKFNFGSVLKQSFLDGLRGAISALPPQAGFHQVMGSRKESDVLQQGKLRVREEVARRIRLMRPNISSS